MVSAVPIGALQNQTVHLANELGCSIWIDERPRCRWDPDGVRVLAPLVVDELSYLTVLHELGHAALGPPSQNGLGVMLSEVEAWAWAIDHALVELSAGARAHIVDALASYVMTVPYGPQPVDGVDDPMTFDYAKRPARDDWLAHLSGGGHLGVPVEHRERFRRLWRQLHRDPGVAVPGSLLAGARPAS